MNLSARLTGRAGGSGTVMNEPSGAQLGGLIVGAVVAGLLCGLLPFVVARNRRRPELAWISVAVCVVAGLILGLLLAIPAALVCTGIILVLEKGPDPSHLDVWQGTVSPAVELTAPAPKAEQPPGREVVPGPSPQPLNLYARGNLKAGEVSIACPKCGNAFAAAVTNLPPWCTRCGADLPRNHAPRQLPPESDLEKALQPVPVEGLHPASAEAVQAVAPDAVQESPPGPAV
jgi:uncharacterized protein (DUF983 family)